MYTSARTFGYLRTRVPDGYRNGYPGIRVPILSTTVNSYFADSLLF